MYSINDDGFGSSVEDIVAKKEIASIVSGRLREDAVSCTGSSGLSITEICECYPEHLRSRFLGVHLFNPPYNMSLCELIPTIYTDKGLLAELESYLKSRLLRTVVVVKDSPAFLANRIGFQFINQAMQYAKKYKDNGGIDYIDAILGPFTGRNMAPLVTADFVGLDIHKAIVDFGHNRGERIAAKALAAGDELTIENLDKYYDIPIAQGWDLHRTYNKDFKDNVTDSCIFAEVWIEKDWAEIGHLYCAVDIAIREGYSKNIKFIPVKNILLGDPHCQSKTIYCKNKEEQNNG